MRLKRGLYILWITLILLPPLFYFIPVYKTKQLNGWIAEVNKPEITLKAIYEGRFQHEAEAFYNDKLCFHPDFVRLRNQIYYSCFDIAYHEKTLIGKQGYFYEKGYINNVFYGLYSQPSSVHREKSEKLFKIQDTLEALGKEFLFVFAPGKGSYYPEYIPSRMLHKKVLLLPNEDYMHWFDSLGVHYIDLDKWFIELKKQGYPPLYSKNGIHYNKYGTYMTIDTLAKYFNKKFPFMPEVILDSIVKSDVAWENENDCFESANVIQHAPKQTLYYPYFHYAQSDTSKGSSLQARKKCIFIGDSYIWPLTLLDFDSKYFDDGQYWYYFNEVSRPKQWPHLNIKDIDVKEELKNTDVIIVMFTNATTLDLDNGFTDKVFELFFEKEK
ncbi:MAG: hypothetical protein IJ681_04425 [Bacteroidales bacterium]|nr:hypothetical protein [Bacteroidales bacterium]